MMIKNAYVNAFPSYQDWYHSLTKGQQKRADISRRTEASEAIEDYPPLAEIGGYAFELEQRWILGEIDSNQHYQLLKKHFGLS